MLQKSVQVNRKILATPTVQCTLYAVKYNIHYTMYIIQCTLYNTVCTQHNAHCTVTAH